jgi:signal transduction histidine kinase/class 3 adenylate cyclase
VNLILTIALATLTAQGGPTPVACCGDAAIDVGGTSIFELVDPGGELTFEDVSAPERVSGWTLNINGVPSRGYSSQAHWFWFAIFNDTAEPQSIVLEIGWPVMNEVDVYFAGEQVSRYSSGSGRLFSLRPLPYHNLAVPHGLGPGERVDVYTRIRTDAPLQFPVKIHPRASFYRTASTSGIMWGIYFGFMLLIAAYNLVLFLSLRETSHLYLSMFVVCLSGLQATFSGHVQQYLFPSAPAVNLLALPIFLNATLLTGILFTVRFLELRKTARRFHWFFLAAGAAAGVNLVVVALFSPGTSTALGNILAVPICLGAVSAGGYLGLKGHSSARIYSFAWVLFLLGATALALNKLEILPCNVVTEYGWSVGAMLMAVLLSMALANSIEKLKRQQEEIQGLVDQRTAELNEQTQVAQSAREEAEQLRKEAEQTAEKLEILDKHKTAFFQNVSHELRTPLTLILNPLDQATRELPGNRNIEVAAKNARRLLRLVNQLLDFQKLEAGKKELKLEPINLVYFAYISGSYFRSACASKNIDFKVSIDGQDLTKETSDEKAVFVQGESDALEKIAFNYLSNALKHTPNGGRIEFGLRVSGDKVRLFVKDNGSGISEKNQQELFKIFSQVGDPVSREVEGTGLGLALVKELTESMRGQVGVESAEGKGSQFWSEFLVCEPPETDVREAGSEFEVREWLLDGGKEAADSADQEDRQAPEEGPGQVVLVVDDLADMRLLISNTLKNRNYRILTAPDGKRGLELAAKHRPDLIITDWMMPVMNGPEFIKKLKSDASLASIPVVLLTARSDEESKLLGTELGADAFIGKPFNDLELVSMVRNLLQLKAREHEVEGLNRQLIENVLKRYLPPDLVDQIISGKKSLEHEPKSTAATILFSDLTGFTEISSTIRAARMARILNDYFSKMTDVIFANGGTIDKFIGDAIMVIFGAPLPLKSEDQAERATRCAQEMQAAMAELNREWTAEGIPDFKMRIGIHHGPVVVGNFGSNKRSEYTAIGPTVNLASRIESLCEPGQVFISGTLYDYLPEERARLVGEFDIKGVKGQRHIYRLLDS